MATTKKALRKQAAKAREAARKAAAQQQPNPPSPGKDPESELAPHGAPSGSVAVADGPDPNATASPIALKEGVTAPYADVPDIAVEEAIDTAESTDLAEQQTPPIAPFAPIVAIDLEAPDVPIVVLEDERAHPVTPEISQTPSAPIVPEAKVVDSALEAPALSPKPRSIEPPILAQPFLQQKSARALDPLPEPAGPSYTRRDPVTGALAEDLQKDHLDHGPSGIVSDEIFALQLQLEEIEQQTDQKGKFRSDRVPDLQLALATFQAEVNRHIDFLNDVRFANSVANAVDVDAGIIAELGQEEIRAEEDHLMAVELDGGQTNNMSPPNKTVPGITIAPMRPASGITIASMKPAASTAFALNEPVTISAFGVEDPPLMVSLAIGQMAALRRKRNVPFDDEDDDIDAASTKTYTERQQDAMHKFPRRAFQCTVCTDMFRSHEIILLDCKHLYCPACLKSTFIHASSDMAFFPPRCCDGIEIPVSLVSDDMSTQEMEDYTDARIEVQTAKRVYCSNNQCGKFVPPANIDADFANCTRCGTITCIHCRGKQHLGECLQDEALRSTLALAETEGWRRCHACRAVVELNVGCYHMTCKCGGQFCYLCGGKWKTCACPKFEEHRLIAPR